MPQSEEEKKQKKREWYKKNKEQIKESGKEYKKENKEKIKKQRKEYRQTPQAKKLTRINHWKERGILPPCSWDEFHDEWEKATNCADCDVVMTVGERYNTPTTKCADHDHSITDGSPNFRGFVCLCCNLRRG